MPIPSYYNKPLDEMTYNERIGKQYWDKGQARQDGNIGYADESTYGGNTGWLRDYFSNQTRQVPIGMSSANIEDLRREHFGLPSIQEQAPQQAPQRSSLNPFNYMGRNPYQYGTTPYDNYMNEQSSAFGAPWMQDRTFQQPGFNQFQLPQRNPFSTGFIQAGNQIIPAWQFDQNPQYYNALANADMPRQQYQGALDTGAWGQNPMSFGNFMQQTGRGGYGNYGQRTPLQNNFNPRPNPNSPTQWGGGKRPTQPPQQVPLGGNLDFGWNGGVVPNAQAQAYLDRMKLAKEWGQQTGYVPQSEFKDMDTYNAYNRLFPPPQQPSRRMLRPPRPQNPYFGFF